MRPGGRLAAMTCQRPAEPTIRPARPDERALLEDLQWRASLSNEAYREALLADRSLVVLPAEQIESGGTLVAEMDGAVVGFATLIWLDGDTVELDGLFVEPAHFGSGIGRQLVEDIKTLARDRRKAHMTVVAGAAARGFYERRGFVVTGTTQTQLDMALVMRAELRG